MKMDKFEKMSFDELRQLNRDIVSIMRKKQREMAKTFSVGEKVNFDSKHGLNVYGSISKVGRSVFYPRR